MKFLTKLGLNHGKNNIPAYDKTTEKWIDEKGAGIIDKVDFLYMSDKINGYVTQYILRPFTALQKIMKIEFETKMNRKKLM